MVAAASTKQRPLHACPGAQDVRIAEVRPAGLLQDEADLVGDRACTACPCQLDGAGGLVDDRFGHERRWNDADRAIEKVAPLRFASPLDERPAAEEVPPFGSG